MEIKKLINGEVTYDKYGGQYFWINEPNGNQQMLCEMRGWGHIQHMFPMTKEGQEEAAKYQDEVGNWIAKAINEKLERENTLKNILTEQSNHSIIACLKELQFNRPADAQRHIDKLIAISNIIV